MSPLAGLRALSHPQVRARGMVVSVECPSGGRDRQLGRPVKFTLSGDAGGASAVAPPRRPPRLGEHDEEILAEPGFRDEKVAALRRDGVIRGEAPQAGPRGAGERGNR